MKKAKNKSKGMQKEELATDSSSDPTMDSYDNDYPEVESKPTRKKKLVVSSNGFLIGAALIGIVSAVIFSVFFYEPPKKQEKILQPLSIERNSNSNVQIDDYLIELSKKIQSLKNKIKVLEKNQCNKLEIKEQKRL